jgi:hypothetical protein
VPNHTPLPHFNGPEPLNPPTLSRGEQPEIPEAKPLDDLYTWLKRQVGASTVLIIVFGVALIWIALRGRDALAAIADERIQPVREDVGKLKAAQDRYESDVHEFGKDLRELYRVSPIVRRSDRLEQPFPDHDGGAP